MSRFIRKSVLKETDVNPLSDISFIDYDERYKQAILNAISSENSATLEYDQILDLEEKVKNKKLVDIFHNILIHLRDQEIEHAAELSLGMEQADPNYKKIKASAEKDVSNLKESIEDKLEDNSEKDKYLFDSNKVEIILEKNIENNDILDSILENIPRSSSLTASFVDYFISDKLKSYGASEEEISHIENQIVEQALIKDNLYNKDIETLKSIINLLDSDFAKNSISELIDNLSTLE